MKHILIIIPLLMRHLARVCTVLRNPLADVSLPIRARTALFSRLTELVGRGLVYVVSYMELHGTDALVLSDLYATTCSRQKLSIKQHETARCERWPKWAPNRQRRSKAKNRFLDASIG
jgi:hypothetical protein